MEPKFRKSKILVFMNVNRYSFIVILHCNVECTRAHQETTMTRCVDLPPAPGSLVDRPQRHDYVPGRLQMCLPRDEINTHAVS